MKADRKNLVMLLLAVGGLLPGSLVHADPFPNCASSSGGPEICVQFDNLEDQPEVNTDFDFDFTTAGPFNPSVVLLRGHDGVTEREWRVWSWTSADDKTPRNIGTITSPAAFDFDVKLLNPWGDAGAANVLIVALDPTQGDKFSRISGGRITGALSGDLFLQESTGGAGGDVSLVIDGDVFGTLTLPRVASLKIGMANEYMTAGLRNTASVIIGEVVAPASPATVIEIGTIEGYDSSHLAKLEINGDLPTNATLLVNKELDYGYIKITGSIKANAVLRVMEDLGEPESPNFREGMICLGGMPCVVSQPPGLCTPSYSGILEGTIDVRQGIGHGTIYVPGVASTGYLFAGGGGQCGGDIVICKDMSGDIHQDQYLGHFLQCKGTVGEQGSIRVRSMPGAFGPGGVSVVGVCHGDITVDEPTAPQGDVRCIGGVGPTGSILLNANEHLPPPAGGIMVGFPTFPPADLQGTITIKTKFPTLAGTYVGLVDVSGKMTTTAQVSIEGGLGDGGTISVGDRMEGNILIQNETHASSRILLNSGGSGLVLVNQSRLDSAADGRFEVGTPSSPVGLDGRFWVWKGNGVGGALNGWIKVWGDTRTGSNIQVEGDANALIYISEDAAGDVVIGGDVNSQGIDLDGSLLNTGRILIDGMLYTAIDIAQGTEYLSQIRISKGLEEAGSISINSSQGVWGADGIVHLGPTSIYGQPPVTFDGSIDIGCGPDYCRVLNGSITVVGCHATADDLDICVCQGTENIGIVQTGCTYQVDVGPCLCP